ncbi:MAG: hypothetical protein SFV15_18380 [Polyangiaceae bacterium]|nr:hypothetical protein [Polyangiaceae bacterium]
MRPNCPSSEDFLRALAREFPGFRIVSKRNDRFSHLIDRALRLVTFGRQRSFISHYHTVIGNTLYTPLAWERTAEVDRVITLRHERIHLLQRKRWGLLPMAFLYLVPLFPVGLALGRARIEWEAYVETLRATAEYLGPEAVRDPILRERIVSRFTGADYGWMWPFRAQVERWYDRALASLDLP